MNPYLVAFIGLEAVALVGFVGWQIVKGRMKIRQQTRELDMLTKLRAAREEAFINGAHLGARALAEKRNAQEGHRLFYGFAERCRKCGAATSCMLLTNAEYWRCACGHRNPSPLPVQPELAKR